MRQPAAKDSRAALQNRPLHANAARNITRRTCQTPELRCILVAREFNNPARRRKPRTWTSQNGWSGGCQPDDRLPERVSRATCDGLLCTTTRLVCGVHEGWSSTPKDTQYTPSLVAAPAYIVKFDCLYRILVRFALARVAARQGYSWRHCERVSSHLPKSTCTISSPLRWSALHVRTSLPEDSAVGPV